MLTCDFSSVGISAEKAKDALKELSEVLEEERKRIEKIYGAIDYDCESDADWEDSEDENDVWD